MKSFSSWLACFLIIMLACTGSTLADDDQVIRQAIISKLKSARSDLDYKFIGPSEIPAFYELQVLGGPILSFSKDGEFFFDGARYKVKVGQFVDVRNLRLDVDRREAFASLSTDEMIIFKSSIPTKAIINVFTHVDCGYCRKLHQEVPEHHQMGVEVIFLAFPRVGIASVSYDKIATALCPDAPLGSLTRSKNGDADPLNVCSENPVAKHYNLGQRLGVTGTPAIVLMDGTMLPGYQKAEALAKILGIGS